MSTGLLVAAVLVGALACPAMMWWQSRRGRVGSCASPFSGSSGGSDVDELRRRHDELAAAIRAAEAGSADDRVGRGTT